MADEVYLRAGAGGCAQRVGFAANEAGKAEQGARLRLHGEQRFAIIGNHAQRDRALVKDVESYGRVALAEKNTVGLARNRSGARVERANQLRISEKCSWVKLHERPSWRSGDFHKCAPHGNVEAMMSSNEEGLL